MKYCYTVTPIGALGAAMPRGGPVMHKADLFRLEKVGEGEGCESTSPDLTWLSSAFAVGEAP